MSELKLTKIEWVEATRQLAMHSPLFTRGRGESSVYLHILMRTCQFRKVEELFRPSWLVHGHMKLSCGLLGLDRQTIWRGRRGLEERGIVTSVRAGPTPASPRRAKLELPGLSRAMVQLFCHMGTKQEGSLAPALFWEGIGAKAEKHWKAKGWKIGKVRSLVDMAEEAAEGRKKSEKAKERNAVKRKGRKLEKIGVSWVFRVMKDICEELDMLYSDGLPSEAEKKMMRGSAKNFVNYCREKDEHPWEMLYEVVERWLDFREDVIVREDGSKVLLPEVVDFMSFFRYRSQIIPWLVGERSRGKKLERNVVDFTKTKKRLELRR